MSIIAGFDNKQSTSFTDQEEGVLSYADVYKKPQASGLVNVVEDFSWYSNSNTSATQYAIDKMPKVFLIEREQQLDSLVSQALYYFNSIKRGASQLIPESVQKLASRAVRSLTTVATGNLTEQKINQEILSKISLGDEELLTSNYLTSLIGIYLTELTGFKYVFPYFENPPSLSNNWVEAAGGDQSELSKAASETFSGVVDEFSKLINITQPGVYIQKAKTYKADEQGRSITLKFPLFNTVKRSDQEPYQQNYELLWLLIYQNKPFRTSFTRIIPPKIYTVNIPGMISWPYAEITNLSVNFVGTVRNEVVNIAGVGSIATPIPEAYEVTITLTSLLTDYANQMVSPAFKQSIDGSTATIGGIIR